MNIAIISGRLLADAHPRGNGSSKNKALLFTVVTENTNADGDSMSSFVPCIIFNPSPQVENRLTKGGKDAEVLLQGRVNCSKYEQNGETKYSTEVIVFNKSLSILR